LYQRDINPWVWSGDSKEVQERYKEILEGTDRSEESTRRSGEDIVRVRSAVASLGCGEKRTVPDEISKEIRGRIKEIHERSTVGLKDDTETFIQIQGDPERRR
jgi:hypothetical protein